jgi:hypothetical protein
MDKKKVVIEEDKEQEYIEAYSEEMLIACQNGKPCNYGICDECPNVIGITNVKENE